MTWQFCNNDDCLDSWHWTDLGETTAACPDAAESIHLAGVVARRFPA
ncbi:hypothetical protein [Arthrobacter sp. StoSoilB5]|nr:hypothetical protein [Arthrobacter sp. StoSoilB5]